MSTAFDADAVRALTERLVAVPSVSPDAEGEGRCARMLLDALPDEIERGTWPLADGRPVLWARSRGRSPRTVLLLGHYDTVGAEEFAALDAPGGAAVAFQAPALRAALLDAHAAGTLEASALARADLDAERDHPGTWLFGRGALDMKAGLAAGVSALAAHADDAAANDGSLLFVATPDEEHASAGMIEAVSRLVEMRDRERLEFVGALNLDYTPEPVAWSGVMGKALAGVLVLGDPTHAGAPFDGVDAAQLVATIAARLTTAESLIDRDGPPPVALLLRDRKPVYNTQTAVEAVLALNLLHVDRAPERTMELLRAEVAVAFEAMVGAMARLSGGAGVGAGRALRPEDVAARVFAWPDIAAHDGGAPAPDPGAASSDAHTAAFDRVRTAARRAGVRGPALVCFLLPPFYPAAQPGASAFTRRVTAALAARGVATRPCYPFITDAAYLAWRDGSPAAVAQFMPTWGAREQALATAAQSLDLDVVNLGPWGRDPHGLLERVYAPYAFGRLPALIAAASAAGLGDRE